MKHQKTLTTILAYALAAQLLGALACGGKTDPQFIHGFGSGTTDSHGHRLEDVIDKQPAPTPTVGPVRGDNKN